MHEIFISIRRERRYLWLAVDRDRDVLETLVSRRRYARAVERFFRKLLKGQGGSRSKLVEDKLQGYGASGHEPGLSATHRTGRYDSNRAEASHQHTTERERRMAARLLPSSTPRQ